MSSMQTRSKLIVASVSAALLMALAVGTTSANRLSISHGNLWKAIFRPLKFVSGGVTGMACEITLEGSFHSGTIRKVERALIGHITRASVGACETGKMTFLQDTLPWHVQYLGFIGRLPNIEGVRLILVGVAFRIHEAIFGRECLARTTETEPATGIANLAEGNENRIVNSLTADSTRQIECPGIGRFGFEGIATVTEVPGGSRNLLVKLI
jgi:hypothetical protein